MKGWTVYEMANRRGPGAVYKYWAWYGEERLRLAPPRRMGGGAGCWVIAGTWPPPAGSSSSRWRLLHVSSPSQRCLHATSSCRRFLHVASSRWRLLLASSPCLWCLRVSSSCRRFLRLAASWCLSGPGAWHPPALTWVPRPGCRERLCVLSCGGFLSQFSLTVCVF